MGSTDRFTQERAFLDVVRRLDKGQLAQLKRNAGNSLSESHGTAWFYKLLNSFNVRQNNYDENLHFLAASLMAMDKKAIDGSPSSFNGCFGNTFSEVRSLSDSASLDRRFGLLIDAKFDSAASGELAFRLRQMVRLALSKEAHIDWPQLFHDLKQWDNPSKCIQKKWARAYYIPDLPQEITFNTTENNQIESIQNKEER